MTQIEIPVVELHPPEVPMNENRNILQATKSEKPVLNK